MKNNRFQTQRNLDSYYREDQNSLQTEQEKARKEKELAKKHFKPRLIVHPRFQNITADEAIEVKIWFHPVFIYLFGVGGVLMVLFFSLMCLHILSLYSDSSYRTKILERVSFVQVLGDLPS